MTAPALVPGANVETKDGALKGKISYVKDSDNVGVMDKDGKVTARKLSDLNLLPPDEEKPAEKEP